MRMMKNLKSCEVGQVEAASSLELAELVQLLRHLKDIFIEYQSHSRIFSLKQSCEWEKEGGFLTCRVPPIAFELFLRYL